MMKRIILLAICAVLSAISINAQDIITKKDGTKIEAKVMAVSDEIVEYKRANYLDGPTFSVSVLDLDYITYANGDKQKFEDVEAQAVEEKGITMGMKYSEYKDLYDAHDYYYDYRDRFSPAGSGIASFFIAGRKKNKRASEKEDTKKPGGKLISVISTKVGYAIIPPSSSVRNSSETAASLCTESTSASC